MNIWTGMSFVVLGLILGCQTQTEAIPAVQKNREVLNQLPAEDRELAITQWDCPVCQKMLGEYGLPVKVVSDGQPVFLCSKACQATYEADSSKYSSAVSE